MEKAFSAKKREVFIKKKTEGPDSLAFTGRLPMSR
jgi:hypothetical protein